ncbi:MAG TPA: uracil-DNA glycosylase family protein, partial [Pseudomonadota bacterium]|nr:uracil-DNA glycosylase family protein [Pseudomonadota bacterium]
VAAQLVALNPRVIVALGRTPTQFLLRNNAPLGRLRGQFGDWNGTAVMPTYHPAYLLRTPSAKAQVWEDLKLVIMRLAEEFGHVQTSASPSLIERNP